MSSEQISQSLEDGILTLTLNRPDKLNAYTAQMGRELSEAFDRADMDDAVRVIIVTGAGRGFCAGADISAGAGAFGAEQGATMFGGAPAGAPPRRFVDAIYECRKPSIAAINGAAVGVGLTLTLPMDIRLSSTDAKYGFVFAPEIHTAGHAGIGDKDRTVFLPLFDPLGRTRDGVEDALLALGITEHCHQLFAGKPVVTGHFTDKLSYLGRAFIVAGHRALRCPEQTQQAHPGRVSSGPATHYLH